MKLSCISLKVTNSNAFLAGEVTGGRKSCSGYIFLQKSLKDCLTVILLGLQ